MKKSLLTALLICASSANLVFAAANYSYQQTTQYPQNNTLKGSVAMVPAGTSIRTILTSPISSEYTIAGQTVSTALCEDFYYNGNLIAPAGSIVYGTVIESSKAKRGSINGRLCIRFNNISTPYGTQIPISGVIKTDDMSGVLVGGTKLDVTKEYAKDMVMGSASGALSGLVFGALAGGDIGRGAALGTAVGAGGGLVKSVIDKGNDVEIPSNAVIDMVLTQPATVSSASYYYEN